MSSVENKPKPFLLLKRTLRETVAFAFWLIIIVKLAIFDIDVYLIQNYDQSLGWLLKYKLFLIAGAIASLWLLLGSSRFLKLIAYVLAYPLIVVFWKMPKLMFRNWALLIVFMPAIHQLISTFRSSFIVQSFAALSAVVILSSDDRYLLTGSMAMLALFLLIHLYRSFKATYRESFFRLASGAIRKYRQGLEGGSPNSTSLWKKVEVIPEKKETETAFHQHLSQLYIFNWGIQYVAEKLYEVANSRKTDLYFIASWMRTLLTTVVAYAFEYWALFKISPQSFSGNATRAFGVSSD